MAATVGLFLLSHIASCQRKCRSREIGCNNDRIALNFNRCIGSIAADASVKYQIDKTNINDHCFEISRDLLVGRLTAWGIEVLWIGVAAHSVEYILYVFQMVLIIYLDNDLSPGDITIQSNDDTYIRHHFCVINMFILLTKRSCANIN